MKAAIFDFETSGLPLFNEPSEDPRQPHICEVAVLLFDGTELVDTMHHVIKQDGWNVDPEAFKAHGITLERSMQDGVDEWVAHAKFHQFMQRTDVRVAHNEQFDQRIARIAYKRFNDGEEGWEATGQDVRDTLADMFKARPSYCTMKTSTPILNLPATEAMRRSGRGSWKKQPSLAEAYRYFFKEDFDNAHSALADTWACARVYFKLTQNVDIGKPS